MFTLIFIGIVYVAPLDTIEGSNIQWARSEGVSTYTVVQRIKTEAQCWDKINSLYADNQAWNGVHGMRSSTITATCERD